MTDKELLELAAKAAGFDLSLPEMCWHGVYGLTDLRKSPTVWWNPLTDDGDALRLAVKLGMCVTAFPKTQDTMVGYRSKNDGRNIEENWGTDPDAATRRAIVRAAAEIGKAL